MACKVETSRGVFHLSDYQELSIITQIIHNKPGNIFFVIPASKTHIEYEEYKEKKEKRDSSFVWPVHCPGYGIRVR